MGMAGGEFGVGGVFVARGCVGRFYDFRGCKSGDGVVVVIDLACGTSTGFELIGVCALEISIMIRVGGGVAMIGEQVISEFEIIARFGMTSGILCVACGDKLLFFSS